MTQHTPDQITLTKDRSSLQVTFNGQPYTLTAELLRVESPSAEVKGHGPGEKKLVSGKKGITIQGIEPIGHYAVQLLFSDGHNSGIYSWDYLYELSQNQFDLWEKYTNALTAAGLSREVRT